jgi:hypothetical protein
MPARRSVTLSCPSALTWKPGRGKLTKALNGHSMTSKGKEVRRGMHSLATSCSRRWLPPWSVIKRELTALDARQWRV